MPDDDLRRQLSDFTAHEITPVESILSQHALHDVFQELDAILAAAQPEAVTHAVGFLLDAYLQQHPFRDAFHEHLRTSKIWETLRGLL